jgi:hypothetical protein
VNDPGWRRDKEPVYLPDLPFRDDPFSEGVILASCIYCDHRLIEDAYPRIDGSRATKLTCNGVNACGQQYHIEGE